MASNGRAEHVRVLTVDDQPRFLRAARDLICATPGFTSVGDASSGEEALELDAALHPDLILMDVNMPGIDGIEATRRIIESRPDAMIVLVSIDAGSALPTSAWTCGASAVLAKQTLSPRVLRELWAAGGARTPRTRRPT